MQHDPFWKQKSTKSTNRQRILTALSANGQTFNELETAVGLSPPILSNYLRKLKEGGIITRAVKGRRIEYLLTEKGKTQRQIQRESFAQAIGMLGQLSKDNELTKNLVFLSDFAKEQPEIFDELLQWMSDYMMLITSDETLEWMSKHRDTNGKLLQAQTMKKLAPFIKNSRSEPKGPEVMIMVFQRLLEAVREVVMESK
ncbi:MAG: winged helix-turn-helix domain-containing protein [Candidatus Bathyarchaeia archaeon]